jgi:hypothetical protein
MERDKRPGVAAVVLAAAAMLLAPAIGFAQPAPAEPPPGDIRTAPPEKIEPGPPIGSPESGETLGEQLDRTDGVIHPPKGIDPGLVEPPPLPPANTPMPVIPPPGTPQNQPNVQPQ